MKQKIKQQQKLLNYVICIRVEAMNDIYIIDYIGNSDDKGNPIGHPTKVINEYSELIKDAFAVNLVIPENYKKVINNNSINSIKYLKPTHSLSKPSFPAYIL
mgnify:CR=1 FL=1